MTTLAVMGHKPNQRFSSTTASGCLKAANMYRHDIFTVEYMRHISIFFQVFAEKHICNTFLPRIIAVNYENRK